MMIQFFKKNYFAFLVMSFAAIPVASYAEESYAIHGQFTGVAQWHPGFSAPYSGENSLSGNKDSAATTDVTLYLGRALWRGAELWVNPEIDQGFGLNNTVGAAGYPSGEAYKVGANRPYLRLPRAFIRQTINLSGDSEKLEASANQLAGTRSANNIVLTVGKFSVVDIFDTNTYAHDPRGDFLNWAMIDSGAFDYAADSWGFTYGAAAEWTQSWWTARAGFFQLSKVPNGKVTSVNFSGNSTVLELEARHQLLGRPGKVKLLGFVNHGKMGSYHDAVAQAQQMGGLPETASVRRVSNRPGVALNLEQELTNNLGVFVRASKNFGDKEAYEFTEINQSFAAGLALKGAAWQRPKDTFGLGFVVNGLSSGAQKYFRAGGMGILIGDGQLNYAPEKIIEMYYGLNIYKNTTFTLGYQHINNPAYNADRGPVNIGTIRLHSEF